MSEITVYLAGPDVFLPDAVRMGRLKGELCRRHGLVGLYPLDNSVEWDGHPLPPSLRIYDSNIGLMARADAIVANLTPFRGPSADAGTVFELGVFAGMGKPAFGYSNVPGSYIERAAGLVAGKDGDVCVDAHGMSIEDFGNQDNLMIVHAIERLGAPMVTPPSMPPTHAIWNDLTQFEACLELVARHFGISRGEAA